MSKIYTLQSKKNRNGFDEKIKFKQKFYNLEITDCKPLRRVTT